MKKRIVIDTVFNIVATAIPILVLQLFVLPSIARNVGDERYGLIITLISLSTIFSSSFGNTLNNTRLLTNNQYESNNVSGDFNILLAGFLVINAFLITLGTIYYENGFSILSISLMVLFSCLNLLREYMIVAFRIKLNFYKILINNIIIGLGYFVGLLLFNLTTLWHVIYIVGLTLGVIYISKNSNIINEKFTKTKYFNQTFHKSNILLLSTLIKSFVTYSDKLLIFPLLGPTAVAIYYSSTILGKVMSMAIMPVSSVLLSYLAKMKKLSTRRFLSIIGIVSLIGIIGYFVTVLISEPVLQYLYPEWATRSMELIYVTTGTAIIEVISSVINPIILRFNSINWQIKLNGINLVIYLALSFTLFQFYGLFGFALGVLIASVSKLIMMILVYLHENKSTLDFEV
jgi:O-antigen/teichoic acid export membrane protein